MSRFGPNNNPITHGFSYHGSTSPSNRASSSHKFKRTVDGFQHVCADGHTHATEAEVIQCIEAHKVYVCASNHMHTEPRDAERCDVIKREEDSYKDKELQRQHDRLMAENQIKLTENLRKMDWNFKRNGMPRLEWKD